MNIPDLKRLSGQMIEAGFVPDYYFAWHDVQDRENKFTLLSQ